MVGYETDTVKPKERPVSGLAAVVASVSSKENRCRGGNVGLKTSSGIQQ